jgi:type I restriction enzyme, S subunit
MTPDTWQVVPLADICDEKISYGIVQAGPHVEDGIPYIKSSDLNRELKLEDLQRTALEIHNKYIRSTVRPGDIIFSLRGNIGLCRIVPASIPEANLTQGTARISVKPEYSTEFFLQQITGPELIKSIQAKAKGSTFQEISLEALRKVPVLVPPKAEQTRIAQILSTWDKAIATTERLLANSQQQKQALMQQLLTGQKRFAGFTENWVTIDFGTAAKIDTGFAFKSSDIIEPCSHSLPIARMSNLKDGALDLSNAAHVHNNTELTQKSFKLQADDFIFGMSGSLENYAWIAPPDLPCMLNQRVGRIRAKQDHNQKFIAYSYLSESTQNEILGKAAGAAQLNISISDLRNLKLKAPSLPEQQKIAQVLSIADAEIANLQAQLAKLKLEKKALMQQLLTGQRRVQLDAEAVA